LRDYLVYSLYRLAGILARFMPPRLAYWIAEWGGGFAYRLSPRLRHTAADNMRHVLGPDAPEAQVQAHVRGICTNMLKNYFDLLRADRLDADEIKKVAQIEGAEHLQETLARGRGVIMVSAHLGNLDLVMHIPSVYGIPVTGVVEHIKPERLYRYFLEQRTSHGLHLIPSDGPMIGLIRALKRGNIVGLACDRALTDNGYRVRFFGAPALLPDGAVRLALRTGTPLLGGFTVRLPDNTFHITIEPVLDPAHKSESEADVTAGMEQMAAIMERHISRHPEQWTLSVPVWPQAGMQGRLRLPRAAAASGCPGAPSEWAERTTEGSPGPSYSAASVPDPKGSGAQFAAAPASDASPGAVAEWAATEQPQG
jgi:lauroyl/myristoyl acyltransferase